MATSSTTTTTTTAAMAKTAAVTTSTQAPAAKPGNLHRRFLQGGLAAMAGACASHPLDLIKVRLQLQGEGAASAPKLGPVAMGQSILRNDGVRGLFGGLTASLARQAVYSSVRFGVYDSCKEALGEIPGERELSLLEKIGAGLVAGAVGAVVANPCDVTLVRMQADGKLPVEARRGYRNVFHGMMSIGQSEGVSALWSGCAPTVARAMIVTASQFAAYDQIKMILVQMGAPDVPATHLSAGFMAGFVASCTSTPADTIKTRMMNSFPGQYSGPIDCVVKTVRQEGPMALYKGFVPTFVRQAPYLVVMFITLEQIKLFYRYLDEN
ncbi:Mitochondrial dicarboxylate carrier [Hondaea fermentalgiana]|uniref:Mitochondrial dicarboxylate carrier n=1 Tax=Hondaea fermentalgiana TaxID=2315210 RepID=A0A2R5GR94_9STRA|nr:Mitochondrial dicarboxylate carrier [Hondaea fermentalgiana]|eukprot:GBG33406.1 Mitochondrial dicarboxylate carrier [Hondaea fermentalgiana]